MRTRKVRDVAARATTARRLPSEVGKPFRVGGITPSKLGELIEDYVMLQDREGLSVKGELFFQPVAKESSSYNKPLSNALVWQLQQAHSASLLAQADEEADMALDMVQHAIENYHYHIKRNAVKMNG